MADRSLTGVKVAAALSRVLQRRAAPQAITVDNGGEFVLDAWRHDYNHIRPHSALRDRTPSEIGAMWVDSREPRESTAARKDRLETEIPDRFVTISPY